jgi:hypothetical protein
MSIVTEYDWQSDTWTQHGDNGARTAWREVVAEIAEKAKATLPQCNGRVDKAVAIVLNHDVELLEDGKAKVASQSNGQVVYHVVNGECSCKDFPKAPSGWCKHRIAAGMQKRAQALVQRQLGGATNGQAEPPSQPQPAPQDTAPAVPNAPLPEAPASCNVYVTLAGRKVQVTLRDSDEQRMLARLDALLQRFPVEAEPEGEPAQPEGWCRKHDVPMTQNHKDGRSWWSHKTAAGWCKGK